jgi:hypothetical protein
MPAAIASDMEKRWVVLVGLMICMAGCVPSKEVRSAGQVGCLPDEIQISTEDYHFGLTQSGETWVAECRGHQYVCTQMNETADSDKGLGTFLGSEQISCKELLEPNPERVRMAAQSPPAPLAAPAAQRVAPVVPRGATP